jgi:hypothetical protein
MIAFPTGKYSAPLPGNLNYPADDPQPHAKRGSDVRRECQGQQQLVDNDGTEKRRSRLPRESGVSVQMALRRIRLVGRVAIFERVYQPVSLAFE